MFVQIRIFLKLIKGMEFKRRSVLIIKYYDDYFALDILYTFAKYLPIILLRIPRNIGRST